MVPDVMRGFAHLHVHSHYTLLGGTASVTDLATRAAAEGMTHLALTDTHALYGAVAFAKACRTAGVQPIVGMTVAIAPPQGDRLEGATPPGQVVLLATGLDGYRSLCRLSSLVQGSPDRESRAAGGLSWEALQAHRQGLICLSGGRAGGVERLLRAGQRAGARRYAGRLADLYGDALYLALEIHRPQDEPVAQEVAGLSQRLGLRSVAVQPVYCLSRQEAPTLRLLAAIDHNCLLSECPPDALPAGGDPSVDLHWLSREDVAARFASLPEALATVAEVVARCGFALPDGRPIWPVLKLPERETPGQALTKLAHAGLKEAFRPEPSEGVQHRLQTELDAILRHGYAPLFLVVADIVGFARQARIPVNTRGSVANSLVAYCIGITNVDPIAHDLLFERFLNPARADLPDIDLDLCSRRRDEVLDYVRRTYGEEHVALVATVSTLQPRGAVRESAKACGLDEAEMDRLVARIPRRWHPDPQRRDARTPDDVIAALDNPRHQDVVREAYGIVGQPHHLSVHPGGVVITPGPLTDWVPVQWAPKGFLITQFDHRDVEAVGLPKIDLLGIRALTVLAEAAELVRRDHDPSFHLADIPLDDSRTADLLEQADTIGVFQCESEGARRTLRQLRARTVRDLAVANAFWRPGPATGGMAQAFVRRYRGEEPVRFLHPSLEPILGATQGVLIFQEQILRVAREIAGFSWAQADVIRRGMTHFGYQDMADLQAQFVRGCQRPAPEGPGLTEKQAETLWEQVLAFSGYGFNQGHATSYAAVSYRSAYLKAHWPAAFFCARLAHWGGYYLPAVYMAEAVRLGLAVRPPHVNHSGRRFTLAWEGSRAILWMGLGQVRDLRRASVRAIATERQRAPFATLRDLLGRVPLQSKEARHLVQCGGLDGLGPCRAAMLAEAREIERAGSALQMTFGFATPVVPAESPAQRLAWEQHILGQPVSVHPVELVTQPLPPHLPLRDLPAHTGMRIAVVGVRLPSWTRWRGFLLGDGETFVTVRPGASLSAPKVWQPVWVQGRWIGDEWGGFWLQAEQIQSIRS
jgi:DNA polymerase-3 subunit alpha